MKESSKKLNPSSVYEKHLISLTLMPLSSFPFEFSITHQFLVITERVKDVSVNFIENYNNFRIIKMIIFPFHFQPSRLHIHFALFTLRKFARWHFYNIIIIPTWVYDSHEILIHIVLLVVLSLVLGFGELKIESLWEKFYI